MKISVIGTGYVGLIAGLGFAKWGNEVTCLDIDPDKIKKLNAGVCPIYEPGATTQLQNGLKSGRLQFTCDVKEAVNYANIIFIAVGTPEMSDGSVDLHYVYEAAEAIAIHMNSDKIVVNKSTVPIGTARKMQDFFQMRLSNMGKGALSVDVASNPEFLREGKAVGDFDNPDRVVLGVRSKRAKTTLIALYNPFIRSNKPIFVVEPETAEMIKYASNAFLATKITFVNEIANLCERVGADAQQVTAAMGKDGRISSKFLHAGPGYGGSCFPKDTKALADMGVQYGARQTLTESVIQANKRQKELAAEKVMARFPDGGVLTILGLSFKPETDDIRESPAMSIVRMLLAAKHFSLRLYDPQAMPNARRELNENTFDLTWCDSTREALEGTDAILIPTEWSEFAALDFEAIGMHVRQKVLFDFRNIYRRNYVEGFGFEYHGTGI